VKTGPELLLPGLLLLVWIREASPTSP